jgi:hypothetical protein
MAHGYNNILNALQLRFDYYSARVQAREALGRAGLDERDAYADEEVQRIVDALAAGNRNLDKVWAKLGVSPSGQPLPAPAKAPEPPSEPTATVEAVAEVADAPVEAPVVSADEADEVVAHEVVSETEASVTSWDDGATVAESGDGENAEGDSTEGENAEGDRAHHGHGRKKDKKNRR